MKLSDFYIGLEFLSGPFTYRCTDVGSRTVAAIKLVENNPVWFQGPPYLIEEEVLDEAEIEKATLTIRETLEQSIAQDSHPGFPLEHVMKTFREPDALESRGWVRYPRPGVMRFDRVRPDGEILHPWSFACANDDLDAPKFLIKLYLPYTQEYLEMAELDFIDLPIARDEDYKRRSCQK